MPDTMIASEAGYTVSDTFRCLENLSRSTSELFLAYCGWEKNAPLHAFGPQVRKNYVMHFVLDGKGTYSNGVRIWNLSRGDVFFIAPGDKYEYVADEKEPWSYTWIGFNGVRAEEFSSVAGFTREEPVRHCLHLSEIQAMISGMLDAHTMNLPDDLHRNALLLDIFSLLIRENAEAGKSVSSTVQEPGFVDLALDYIVKNIDKNIRINDLASRLNVSRSYLSSSFKKALGCSPQTFILNLRMERAKNLLRTTTLPINVIADSVGYQDQLAFSKIFKHYFGVSPRDFRKNGEEVRTYSKKGEFDKAVL